MPATIIGNNSPTLPLTFYPAIVETWQDLGDGTSNWVYDPELQLVSFGLHASAISTAEIERRYGNVKMTYESDFPDEARIARDLTDWWVRISIPDDGGTTVTQFVGQVENQSRVMTGNAALPAGTQNWIVSGGQRILQRITISQSVFAVDQSTDHETQSKVGWVPAMNARDKRGLMVGNRCDSPQPVPPGSPDEHARFAYGGKTVWTHLQYLQYIVDKFVQQNDNANGDGTGNPVFPRWTITGQTDVLDGMQTTIKFNEAATAEAIIKELIPPKYGVDFVVRPTDESEPGEGDDGFEINIFALAAASQAVAGVTMPANPNLVQVVKDNEITMTETHVVEADERRVDRVQVIGARIVVCGTLKNAASQAGPSPNLLVKRWSNDIENDYKIAAGTVSNPDNPITPDTIRGYEKYEDVFQHVGAPDDWQLQDITYQKPGTWSVSCNDDGTFTTAAFQQSMRETLGYIPLKEGFDYSVTPPVDNTGMSYDGAQSDTKPPLAWIYDDGSVSGLAPGYVPWKHVRAPFQDWGLILGADPNHTFALNHWSSSDAETSDKQPLYDYLTAIITIAIESDHRLSLGYTMPDELSAGDGSVMTIIEEEAEAWVMLPYTILDVNPDDGTPVESPSQLTVLRNDLSRLQLVMAGAVSRYINGRLRVALTFKGFNSWMNLVGQILTVVQQGDDVQQVGAPITSVEWMQTPTPVTVVKTGYA